MNPENENFEQLRRLLALKRHEQPPPGYFHNFSGQVIARIKAGERGDRSFDTSWLHRFWSILEAKPAFAGVFGAAVCAVLISGIFNSEEEGGMMSTANFIPSVNRVDGSTPVTAISQIADSQTTDTNSLRALDSLFDPNTITMPASETFILPGAGHY